MFKKIFISKSSSIWRKNIFRIISYSLKGGVILIVVCTVYCVYRLVFDLAAYYEERNFDQESWCVKHLLDERCIRKEMVNYLVSLDALPSSVKKHLAIYIPKNNKYYWDWGQNVEGAKCVRYDLSFLAPFISGISLIHGLPSKECYMERGSTIQVGYTYEAKANYSDYELCSSAFAEGFNQVIILNYGNEGVYARLTKCLNSGV